MSMGGTNILTAMSTNLDFFQQTSSVTILIAPTLVMNHSRSPLVLATAPFYSFFTSIYEFFGIVENFPYHWMFNLGAKFICGNWAWFCSYGKYTFADEYPANIDLQDEVTFISHYMSGASTKTIFHLGQLYHSPEVGYYNYGSKEANIAHYGRE